jgi:histidine ammonia-lyase
VVDNVYKILAIELFNAAQALEFRRPYKTSEFLEEFMNQYRARVDFVDEDTLMYRWITRRSIFWNPED